MLLQHNSSLVYSIEALAYMSNCTSAAHNYQIQNKVSDCYKHTSLLDCFINWETKSCYSTDSSLVCMIKTGNELSGCYKHTSLLDCFINCETKSSQSKDTSLVFLIKAEAHPSNSTLTVHKYRIKQKLFDSDKRTNLLVCIIDSQTICCYSTASSLGDFDQS